MFGTWNNAWNSPCITLSCFTEILFFGLLWNTSEYFHVKNAQWYIQFFFLPPSRSTHWSTSQFFLECTLSRDLAYKKVIVVSAGYPSHLHFARKSIHCKIPTSATWLILIPHNRQSLAIWYPPFTRPKCNSYTFLLCCTFLSHLLLGIDTKASTGTSSWYSPVLVFRDR